MADLVDALNQDGAGVEVRLETLADYVARPEVDDRLLPEWTGELRSCARANMLMGVNSARIDIKAACGRVERLLERYAEPLTALHGGAWPERLLELAWRRVVDNSAHDSICGCSHDSRSAPRSSSGSPKRSSWGAGSSTPPAGESRPTSLLGSWAVVNPSPTARTDLITLDVSVPPGGELAFSSEGNPLVHQELARLDPVIARIRLHGAAIPSSCVGGGTAASSSGDS